MKKLVNVLMIVFMMVFFGGAFTNKSKALETPKRYIFSTERSSILVNANENIARDDIVLQYNDKLISFNDVQIINPATDLEVTETYLKAKVKGAHRFLLQYESLNMYAYVIAKDSSELDFTLFDNNFDDVTNGTLPDGFTTVSGKGSVIGGKLVVDGMNGNSMVLLPDYLKGLSNYVIETDFTIVDAKEPTRWASVMFRYQPNHYYQMAIRQGAMAANGVEFAKNIGGSWNVPQTIGYLENIDPAKVYRLKIEVFQNSVKEYINGVLQIEYNQAIEYESGYLGMQANGSIASYDNFKVTMPMEYNVEPKIKLANTAKVYEPETGIINAPTILTRLTTLDTFNSYLNNKRPATVILNVNTNLEVLDNNGSVIKSLEEMLILFDGQMIPALETEDPAIAADFARSLMEYQIMDFFIISANKEVILAAREANQMARGILKVSEIPDNPHEIRVQTNTAQAIAVLLPTSKIDYKLVNYLQQRLVTVFAESNGELENDLAIFSGVNGILTDKPLELINRYERFTRKTHIREVFFIAHRGLHNGYNNSLGPENSLEVAVEAMNRGAKILETDIHLTKDNQLVVMHDNSTNRTAEIGLEVKDTDLEFLTPMKLKDISNTGNTFNIPSLDKYLDTFKGKDVVLFIEVKPTNEKLLEVLHEVLTEKEMFDQVVLIMFGAQNAVFQKEVSPGMSNGHLISGIITGDVDQTILNVLSDVVPIKTTFNPQYGGLTPEIVKGLTHRGVTIWPWTVDLLQDIKHLYEAGVGGITTNNFDLIKDNWLVLEFEKTEFQYSLKDKNLVKIEGILKSHDKDNYPIIGSLILIDDGGTGIKINEKGEVIEATKEGVAYFYTVATGEFPDGTTYEFTSPILKINVVKDLGSGSSQVGLIIGVALGVLAISGVVAFFVIRKIEGGKQ